MRLTDIKIAEYCGTSTTTLRNWRVGEKVGNTVFYPPTGRHHLYVGAKLVTYFSSISSHIKNVDEFGDIEVADDFNNNFDYIKSDFDFVYKFICLYCTNFPSFEYLEYKLDNLKKHIDNIDNILSKKG